MISLAIFLMSTGAACAPTATAQVVPRISTVFLKPGSAIRVRLSPGYITAVRFPEEINSIALGDPSRIKVEHSEAEPRLVFLKPVASEALHTNALITLKSGQAVNLNLLSMGKTARDPEVDFFIDSRRSPDPLVVSSDAQPFLIADTRPLGLVEPAAGSSPAHEPDFLASELDRQRSVPIPNRNSDPVSGFLGDSRKVGDQTLTSFSIVNHSPVAIELLAPQIELIGSASGKQSRSTKFEPVIISEYRMSARRLGPGARADGVVLFDRPAFKESGERLELRIAQADEVDHPVVLPLTFTPQHSGELR